MTVWVGLIGNNIGSLVKWRLSQLLSTFNLYCSRVGVFNSSGFSWLHDTASNCCRCISRVRFDNLDLALSTLKLLMILLMFRCSDADCMKILIAWWCWCISKGSDWIMLIQQSFDVDDDHTDVEVILRWCKDGDCMVRLTVGSELIILI